MAKSSRTYSIQDLTGEFSLTPRTLRFYEDQGLISPKRAGQTRVYSARDRARLAYILRGKRVGFTLKEIAELLDLYDLDDGKRIQQRAVLGKCRDRIGELKRQRKDIDLTIGELEEYCQAIEAALDDQAQQTGRKKPVAGDPGLATA